MYGYFQAGTGQARWTRMPLISQKKTTFPASTT